MKAIEVKVRLTGDFRDWEDKRVDFLTIDMNEIQLKDLLAKLHDWSQTEFVSEIRWNYVDSPQGHYFVNQIINDVPTLSILEDLREYAG